MRIRIATAADTGRLGALCDQLGYPVSADALRQRLTLVLSLPDHAVLVAETSGGGSNDAGAIAGWIHVAERHTLEAPPCGEILGLVVDRDRRGAGLGRALVEAAETWTAARGFDQMAVRSNIVRPESHPFYERIGYRRVKTQHVYARSLADATPLRRRGA